MDRELKQLQKFFELINIKAFCREYGLNYDFLRRVLKGDFNLTAAKLEEYRQAMQKYIEI